MKRTLLHLFLPILFFHSFIPQAMAERAAVSVEVKEALPSVISQSLRLTGSLTAKKQSQLSPRVDGLVSRLHVESGDRVNKGDILIELDSTLAEQERNQYQAALIQAEVDKKEAQRLVKEAERLRAQNHISQSELAKRQATLNLKIAQEQAAKANLSSAIERIARHKLPAPFTGVITNRMTEVGEWVSRGDPILHLTNLQSTRLEVLVPQEHYAQLSRDVSVKVFVDSLPHQQLNGKIEAIIPTSQNQARAFRVRIQLEADNIILIPGSSATAEFIFDDAEQTTILIPRDALLLNPDGGYSVFVIKDDLAERKAVQISAFTPKGVQVTEGISAHDLVVTRGNEVLHNQQKVIIKSQH